MAHDQQEHKRGFKDGVRFSVTWLHEQARSMNDPKARAILNAAAFHLGVDLNREKPLSIIRHAAASETPVA